MVNITCQLCGKTFQVHNYRSKTAKFCSRSCLASSKIGILHPKWKGGDITLKCRNCGGEYSVPQSEKDRSHFCSKKCNASFNQRGEMSHLWSGGAKPKSCPVCGKIFIPKRSGIKVTYCSRECISIGQKILVRCPGCDKEFRVHKSWLDKGRNYCSISCYRHHKIRPNSIEKAIQDGLASHGIIFIPEYKVGRLHVDIFIPMGNIAVECDGDYWHKGRESLDKRREERLRERGLNVIRFTESDIRKSPETCINIILDAIHHFSLSYGCLPVVD